MKIAQTVTLEAPRAAVWALFQDVQVLADCMPGAELTEDLGDGRYRGRVSIRMGPFSAAFEGEATHVPDHATFSGRAEGRAVDKKGGSRSKLKMDYALEADGPRTLMTVDADIQLSGPIAQFGRTGVVEETATLLIGQFTRNIEARLAPAEAGPEAAPAPAARNEISAFALFGHLVRRFFARLFARQP